MKYDEIINLPHYEPKYHKRMSKSQRAAQFSPFSALTGYDEMVKETERLTKDKIIISDDEINVINEKLNYIIQNKMLDSYVSITYFVKDLKKDGGKYYKYNGKIKKFDNINKEIILNTLEKVSIDDIINIEL